MMNEQERFIRELHKYGASFTYTERSGDQCPCMISRDPNHPTYNPQWHVDNPTAEDCNGTGLINVTTTTKNMKGFFIDTTTEMSMKNETIRAAIGEISDVDLVLFGQIDEDGNFISINSLVEREDYITFESNKYILRNNKNLTATNTVGEISLLVKINE